MNLSTLLRPFTQIDAIQNLIDDLALNHPPHKPLGVPTAARPAFLAALHQNLQRPIIFITARTDRARTLAEQLRLWLPNPRQVWRFPDPTVLPYERIAWNLETLANRVAALTALTTQTTPDTFPFIVTSARALMQKTMPMKRRLF